MIERKPSRRSKYPCVSLAWFALPLMCACGPLYEATAEGASLSDWKAPSSLTDVTSPVTHEVSSSTGTRYAVTMSVGMRGHKRVPAEIEIVLVANPTNANVTVRCRAPMQFDSEPAEVFSTPCEASELTGQRTLTGKSSSQHRSVLRVIADGRVVVDET